MAMGTGLMISNWMIYPLNRIAKMKWGYASLIPFYFMIIRLWLCFYRYGPLMVAVLCDLMWPYRCYFMQYDYHGLDGTTWSNMMLCIVVFCKVWLCLSICELMWKYVFFLCMLGNHVDCDYVLVCVVLGLMHGCS